MAERIVYTRADGNVCVVEPLDGLAAADIIPTDVPAGATNITIVDAATIPTVRTYRGAWEHTAGVISVNMPKARAIVTDQVRQERDKRLAAEDIAFMRADEQNDDVEKKQIAAKKQALRDLPSTIQSELASVKTPE